MKLSKLLKYVALCVLGAVVCLIFASCSDGNITLGGVYTYEHANKFTSCEEEKHYEVDVVGIREVNVEWIKGEVNVSVDKNATQISFFEKFVDYDSHIDKESFAMRYRVDEGELDIRFAKNRVDTKPLSVYKTHKILTLVLPEFMLESFEFEGVSSDINVADVVMKDAEIKTVSGNVRFEKCVADEFDVKSVSGNVFLTECVARTEGEFYSTSGDFRVEKCTFPEKMSFETVSGNVNAIATSTNKVNAKSISGNFKAENLTVFNYVLDTTSGEYEIIIPSQAKGFAADFSSTGGDIITDLPTVKTGKTHTYGNGAIAIKFNSISGNLKISQSLE